MAIQVDPKLKRDANPLGRQTAKKKQVYRTATWALALPETFLVNYQSDVGMCSAIYSGSAAEDRAQGKRKTRRSRSAIMDSNELFLQMFLHRQYMPICLPYAVKKKFANTGHNKPVNIIIRIQVREPQRDKPVIPSRFSYSGFSPRRNPRRQVFLSGSKYTFVSPHRLSTWPRSKDFAVEKKSGLPSQK